MTPPTTHLNPILYRDHSGSLSDSMQTVREVKTKQDIIDHLNQFFNIFGHQVVELKFTYYGFDPRVNWQTYMVGFRLKGEKQFMVAGMCNGQLK